MRWRKTQRDRREERRGKNGRTRAEEQERKNRNGIAKNKRTGTAPTPRRARTERPAQKDKSRAKEQKNRTKKQEGRPQEQKTRRTQSKDKTTTTPAPSPPPHQGHLPRCLAVATNKTTNKTTDTEHRHSCCRPNCTRPFGPRSVVTSTIPALDRAGYTLILFLLSPTLPLPPLGGVGGEDKVTNKTKTMNLNIIPPCLPQLVNKKKKKYIRKQHDNKTTHELQANCALTMDIHEQSTGKRNLNRQSNLRADQRHSPT